MHTNTAVEYNTLTDERLLQRIHQGDGLAQDFLIDKYKNLVKMKTRLYFIIGADKEDIIQEGMIGLYKAIRDFDATRNVLFYVFAELCITRQIISAIKAATRQKHMPLNSYVSLNKPIFDGDSERSFIDMLVESRITSPEELFIGREEKRYIERHINQTLSTMEHQVLDLYLQGKSYVEIGTLISKGEKAIDNALQRVRRKVEKIIAEKT